MHYSLHPEVASLAFLTYEHMITLGDEIEIIWPKQSLAWIKWVYMFIRYFALAAQTVNRVLDFWIASHSPFLSEALRRWHISQVAVGCVLMLMVEAVLMARVYALYDRSKIVYWVFAIAILVEISALVLGVALSKDPSGRFDVEMFLRVNSRSYMFYGIAAILTHIVILGLTVHKYKAAIKGGWAHEPIMELTMRDGATVFAILLSVTTLIVVAGAIQSGNANIANSWFLSIVACVGCRLIINLQEYALDGTSSKGTFDLDTTVQLTAVSVEAQQHGQFEPGMSPCSESSKRQVTIPKSSRPDVESYAV